MAKRDLEVVQREIEEIRSRLFRANWDTIEFDIARRMSQLKDLIGTPNGDELHRHVVVSSIAALQTFHRGTIISIVDSDEIYRMRAAEAVTDKFSMKEALTWLTGKTVSFGELVAHAAPSNSVTDLISWLETLLDCDMNENIRDAIDPSDRRNNVENPSRIVADVDVLLADLAEAFQLRHILAHEAAPNLVITAETCSRAWNAVRLWTIVIDAILWATAYAHLPLTQYDMNKDAGKRLESARKELAGQMRKVLAHGRTYSSAHWLRANHFAWKRVTSEWHRNAYGDLQGTMWPAVRGDALANAIQARAQQVRTLAGWQNPEDPE